MARTSRDRPRSFLDDPAADFAAGTITPTPESHAAARAQALAANVLAAVQAHGTTVRKAAADAGVDYSAVYAALRGDTWLDTRSLALLERVLGPLWQHGP